MIDKVPIELTPFDALSILTFLKEYDLSHPQLQALNTAVKNYENEVCKNITMDQIDDAKAERAVNILIDKEPG